MWEFVDRIVYINLEKRKDRNDRFISEIIPKFGNHPVIRFDAIENQNGAVGCYLSHINVLREAMKADANSVLILEDDIQWNRFDENYKKLQLLASRPYDVIMLGGTAVQARGDRVISANCSHAYLVHKYYMRTLLKRFEEGIHLLIQKPDQHYMFDLDQFWKYLQNTDNWYILQPAMLYQISGYSDILKEYKPLDTNQPF